MAGQDVFTINVNIQLSVYLITMDTNVTVQEVATMVTGVKQILTVVKLMFVTMDNVWTKLVIFTVDVKMDTVEIGMYRMYLAYSQTL